MATTNKNLIVTPGSQAESLSKYVTFRLGDEFFGVNILDVKEVTPVMTITPIFHSNLEISGYVNIRGEIHLVINLRYLFGLQAREIDNESRIVIFKPSVSEPFGILVDRVGDVLEINQDIIEPYSADQSRKVKTSLLTGVCKLDDTLLMVLDAHLLLNSRTDLNESK
jgi:purine-binding chemotaxis protein CheW